MTLGATPKFSPTELISVINQTLDYAYPSVLLEGEVASFKINQGKWVFFDLKDENSSISCFMTLYQLKIPLEDGMKVVVSGTPKLTKWGKFSFTVQKIQPVGQGSIKKAFELLKEKLTKEGLFDLSKKRALPPDLAKIGVISSTAAAGYADFLKILNARWGGLKIQVAHTQVQGMDAPEQIIKALKYFNEHSEVEIIAILRGGGSADDLSCFNDEELVRAIAGSKIPVITGIGHEVDVTLADLAADIRASTPSNAAEMLSRDRKAEKAKVRALIWNTKRNLCLKIDEAKHNTNAVLMTRQTIFSKIEEIRANKGRQILKCRDGLKQQIVAFSTRLAGQMKLLEALNPEKILAQGYAILTGKISPGSVVKITTLKQEMTAEIKTIEKRKI